MDITSIDFFILAVVLISTVISLLRGLLKEAMSLGSWLLALAAALKFTDQLVPLIPESIDVPSARHLTAFVGIFVSVVVAGGIVSTIVNKKINGSELSSINRALGAIFGAIRGLLIISLIISFLGTTKLPEERTWQQSVLIPRLKPLTDAIQKAAPDILSSEIVIDRYPGGITPLFKNKD